MTDALLGVGIAVPGLLSLPWSAAGTGNAMPTVVLLLVCGAAVATRSRWPLTATVAGSLAYMIAVQTASFHPDQSGVSNVLVTLGVLLWLAVLAFTLGTLRHLPISLIGMLFLLVAPQWAGFNPFLTALAIGPWLIGRLARSQQELLATLAERGGELARERERYAVEAIRYERARIARELHDVVAHCMSIVVIQAAAGQRLDEDEPALAGPLFDDISELARHASSDIAGLTRLLRRDTAPPSLSRDLIDRLIINAALAGTHVQVTISGNLDMIPTPCAAALNRILQEGVTNAIKHAPGAAVTITVTNDVHATSLMVHNVAAGPAAADLHGAGGGNGLNGIRQRIIALGGTLGSGPTTSGGWLLSATIPAAVPVQQPSAI